MVVVWLKTWLRVADQRSQDLQQLLQPMSMSRKGTWETSHWQGSFVWESQVTTVEEVPTEDESNLSLRVLPMCTPVMALVNSKIRPLDTEDLIWSFQELLLSPAPLFCPFYLHSHLILMHLQHMALSIVKHVSMERSFSHFRISLTKNELLESKDPSLFFILISTVLIPVPSSRSLNR